jgi:hypothetical protein
VPRTFNEGAFKIELNDDATVKPSQIRALKLALSLARQRLAAVVGLGTARSQERRFKTCVGTYFRAPGGIPLPLYNQKILTLTQNLAALRRHLDSPDVTFKAVEVGPETSDAAAYVQRGMVDVIWDLTFGANPSRPADFYGPIFLRFDQLGTTATAAANVIHEATHRYLGTRDWAYLPNYDMLDYETSYANYGVPPPRPPKSVNALKAWYDMSFDEGLNNADSYAGFVMHL